VVAVGAAYMVATSWPALFRKNSIRNGDAASEAPTWCITLLSGSLFALAVRPLIATLSLSPPGLVISLWLLLFVLGFLLSMIEAVAFSDGPSPLRPRHFLGAMAAAAAAALAAGTLIPAPTFGSLTRNLQLWADHFGTTRLLLRIVGAAVAFMVAYCFIGSLTWPFVRPYYTDPKLGLRLRIPSGPTVILLQLARGLLAVLALSPLLASSSAHGFDWWTRFSLALATTSGVIPLLGATRWPIRLRITHGVEIVVFALVYALALGRIFGA
jgi:hypothetical protein